MARLPQPGGDDGNWGIILNEYLRQIHTESGDLKPSTVGKDAIQNAAITEDKLASPLVAKINAIPTGGGGGGTTQWTPQPSPGNLRQQPPERNPPRNLPLPSPLLR